MSLFLKNSKKFKNKHKFIFNKFMQILIKNGNKQKAAAIVRETIKEISYLLPFHDPIKVFFKSIDNINIPVKLMRSPRSLIKRRKITLGSNKKILLYRPFYSLKDTYHGGKLLGLHLLIKGASIKKQTHFKEIKNKKHLFSKALASEIIAIYDDMYYFLILKNNTILKTLLQKHALSRKKHAPILLQFLQQNIKSFDLLMNHFFEKKYFKLILLLKYLYKIKNKIFSNDLASRGFTIFLFINQLSKSFFSNNNRNKNISDILYSQNENELLVMLQEQFKKDVKVVGNASSRISCTPQVTQAASSLDDETFFDDFIKSISDLTIWTQPQVLASLRKQISSSAKDPLMLNMHETPTMFRKISDDRHIQFLANFSMEKDLIFHKNFIDIYVKKIRQKRFFSPTLYMYFRVIAIINSFRNRMVYKW